MILVMGVGRSGTSTVARILHTRLGVCMGHHKDLEKPAEGLPNGSYEDLEMLKVTRNLVGGNWATSNWKNSDSITTDDWLKSFSVHDVFSSCRKPRIGCKVTHLAALTPKQVIEINPSLVIRTYRPKHLVVASLKHYRYRQKEDWEVFYDVRETSMDKLEEETSIPFYIVEFGEEHREDSEVMEDLQLGLDRYL